MVWSSLLFSLSLLSICKLFVLPWHIYNDLHHQERNGEFCEKYVAAETEKEGGRNIFSKAAIDPLKGKEWKLWRNASFGVEGEHHEVMLGFERALDIVWKNQHPSDCRTAKYIVSRGSESGFGSELHVEGASLAVAINMGRVFLPWPDKLHSRTGFFVNNSFCSSRSEYSFMCYFEPWSNCSILDAIGGDCTAHTIDCFALFHHPTLMNLDSCIVQIQEMSSMKRQWKRSKLCQFILFRN